MDYNHNTIARTLEVLQRYWCTTSIDVIQLIMNVLATASIFKFWQLYQYQYNNSVNDSLVDSSSAWGCCTSRCHS